jgi:predicted kinase
VASGRNPLTDPETLLAVAVTGPIASGKSTIARQVAEQIGATLLVADRIRESGVADFAREGSPVDARLRAFERSVDEAVYAELLRRAEDELAAGRSVVLDAAFPERTLRAAVRALAARHGARFRLVECRAGEEVVRARLAARAAETGVLLERWLSLCDGFDARFEPPDELSPAERLQLDTSGPAAGTAAALRTWLDPSRAG